MSVQAYTMYVLSRFSMKIYRQSVPQDEVKVVFWFNQCLPGTSKTSPAVICRSHTGRYSVIGKNHEMEKSAVCACGSHYVVTGGVLLTICF